MYKKYNDIYEDRYGFLKNESTTEAILKFNQECYSALYSEEHLISVLLDFSKAFDTISHDILIKKKLELSGISLNLLSILESCLSIRLQYVQIDGQKFSSSNITCSVPQGSILGPLLFILYINDLNVCTKDLKFINFADDSTFYAKRKSLSDLAAKINTELHKVDKWLKIIRLFLKVSKSFFTMFSSVSQANLPVLYFKGNNLVHSPTTKSLGILVDNKLNFAQHTRDVCTKVSTGIGVCKKLTLIMPFTVIRELYFTLIYPILT